MATGTFLRNTIVYERSREHTNTHYTVSIHTREIVYTPVYTSSSTGLNTKHSIRLITLQPPIKQQRLRTVTINDNGRLNGEGTGLHG